MKEQKQRQSKEESLMYWEVERDSFKGIELSKTLTKLMQIVDRKIQEYTLTYDEYLEDVVKSITDFEETDDLEKRKEQVENMYASLIEKYSTDGSDLVEATTI